MARVESAYLAEALHCRLRALRLLGNSAPGWSGRVAPSLRGCAIGRFARSRNVSDRLSFYMIRTRPWRLGPGPF